MTARKRVIEILSHREADRVPVNMAPTVGFYKKLVRHLKIETKREPEIGIWTEVNFNLDMLDILGLDIVHIAPEPPEGWSPKTFSDGSFTDEWGVVYKKKFYGDGEGYYYEMIGHPLAKATMGDLESYPWPNTSDPSRFESLRDKVQSVFKYTNFAIMVSAFGALFETAEYLRGQEQWLVDLIQNPLFAKSLLDRLCALEEESDRRILEAVGDYIQIFHLGGEDLGTQQSPLISPTIYRDIVKPYHMRRWQNAKELFIRHNPEGKLMIHSCGAIYPFIQDFIDCGIDILDPIQPLAVGMGASRLKRDFGTQLCFCGGIDIQRILPFGSVSDVREEVKKKIEALAPGGGYIISPAHFIPDNVPPKNIMAMLEAAREFGTYPLNC